MGGAPRLGRDHHILHGRVTTLRRRAAAAPEDFGRGRRPRIRAALAAFLLAGAGAGCGLVDDDDGGASSGLAGRIDIDGSSTVEPFTALAADRFQRENPGVAVVVSIAPSGTRAGFDRFCEGETDLSSASRAIEDEEIQACREQGIEYVEFQVANDAITVVVNPENDWVDCLTTAQLKEIWEPGSDVETWSQVSPRFPHENLGLFGAGADSGTFDHFTGEIVGEEGASRADYTASEDDYVTVLGVAGTRGGLGYFGLSYFTENEDRLKALEIDGGSGCVAPSIETVQSGEYAPLSRPLFIYASKEALREPSVSGFVEYTLDNAVSFAEEGLLVPVTDEQLRREQAEFNELKASVGLEAGEVPGADE
jgi:phosphate transport system substrate-binding protein